MIKETYDKPTARIILNEEKLGAFGANEAGKATAGNTGISFGHWSEYRLFYI